LDKHSERTALIINVDGKEHEVSFEELTLSNNLALEALVGVLAKKGLITPEEFVGELNNLEKLRFGKNE